MPPSNVPPAPTAYCPFCAWPLDTTPRASVRGTGAWILCSNPRCAIHGSGPLARQSRRPRTKEHLRRFTWTRWLSRLWPRRARRHPGA